MSISSTFIILAFFFFISTFATDPVTESSSKQTTINTNNEDTQSENVGQKQLTLAEQLRQQVPLEKNSPFSSLLQNLFPSSLLTSSQPSVSFATTNDNEHLIAKISIPKQAYTQQGSSRNLAYALTSPTLLQVRVQLKDDRGVSMTSSTRFTLPQRVTKKGMTVTSSSDGDVQIKLKILKGDEKENLSDYDNSQSLLQPSGHGENDKIPDMDAILDSLFGEHSNGNGAMVVPMVPITIKFRPFGGGGSDLGKLINGFFEELPSSSHSDRCKQTHSDDKLLQKKCLCDVTPIETRGICYSKMIAKSIKVSKDMILNDFSISTKEKAMNCLNGTEDKVQCLERVASHVVSYISDVSDARVEKDELKKALELDDFTDTSAFTGVKSGLLMLVLVLTMALILSIAFWASLVYAMRRGWFGQRSGGLLSHLSSALTQRTGGDSDVGSNGNVGGGGGGGGGGLPVMTNGGHRAMAPVSKSKYGDKFS